MVAFVLSSNIPQYPIHPIHDGLQNHVFVSDMSDHPWLQDLIQADWRRAVSNEMLGQHFLPQDPICIALINQFDIVSPETHPFGRTVLLCLLPCNIEWLFDFLLFGM